jgi:UDP-N-acetylmuramyl pentapeptide phosphotransferase/UDP-N-acetylglucosamine-1-phosphate transferase
MVGLAASAIGGGPSRGAVCLAAALAGATAIGLADDIRPLAWRPKLLAQTLCCILAVAGLPADLRLVAVDALFWPERGLMILALVAFMNFVNFVDGIDEITAAHAAPALGAVALIAGAGLVEREAGLIAAAGFGAVLGFWLWNRHPARLFLGDSGSLSLGLLVGWLALRLGCETSLAAGLLIVLYPACDALVTLARRWHAGARITEPHRDHAYQRAVDGGMPVRRVAGTVALVSLLTAGLAVLAALVPTHPLATLAAFGLGMATALMPLVAWRGRMPRPGGSA